MKPTRAPTRDELIESYVPLVKATVTRYIQRQAFGYHLYEDMVQEGLIKLTRAANQFADHGDKFNARYFANYVRLAVNHACVDVLRADRPIQRPRVNGARRVPFPNVTGAVASPETVDCFSYSYEDNDSPRVQYNTTDHTAAEIAERLAVCDDEEILFRLLDDSDIEKILHFIDSNGCDRRGLRKEVESIVKRLIDADGTPRRKSTVKGASR